MASRVTIKDIAKNLNVHHSTVSRALRDDKRVKPETRKLIVDYAREHGYRVNMSALHLRGDARNEIAIIVPNINHQFFSNIISHITNLANQNGYVVSIFQSNENYQQEKEIVNTILQNNVAGVIASVSMETLNGDHFLELKKYKVPLVLFDRVCDVNVSQVIIDNQGVVEEVVSLLADKGYKKIAHVSGTTTMNVFRERQKGYVRGIEANGLSYQRICEVKKGFTIQDGKEIAETLFFEGEKPDAIICDSYNLLLGIVVKLKELKLEIPKDVGLIGFGENPSMEVIEPNISAIVQPDIEMASQVFNLLSKNIQDENWDQIVSIKLSAKIIERESI